MKITKTHQPLPHTIYAHWVECPEDIRTDEKASNYLRRCANLLKTDVILYRKNADGSGKVIAFSYSQSPNNRIELQGIPLETVNQV